MAKEDGIYAMRFVSQQMLIDKLQQENKQLKERIKKALNKINNMFDRGDTNTIIDDLLELDKILKGSDSNE